uniref:Ig-like domain-containing protein n=1 Tax=Meleagris gallopavo TaxID=9103 RepID=A0A803YD59_MELGA
MAAGLGPWLLALALGPAGVCAQWRLEASGGGVRAPGESVHLSCQGYGLRLAGVWWYRQAPGGHLKWLSDISTSSYVRSSPEVEGRVKGSRDDSRSIISLSLHNLRPEDSAHYFCAFHTGTGNPADL